MLSVSLLFVYLSGASLILLTAVSEAQYYDLTATPDYEDYNASFEYSFYSNTSIEDLDKFSERFIDTGDEEGEDTGGQEQDVTVTAATTPVTTEQGYQEQDVTVTAATIRVTTEQGWVRGRNAASLPVSMEIRTLVWTVMILNSLQHTL
ncbi:hypothetical protein PBY51_004684 [Eleginops maclovinus]|uniref:Uncharacterized protein n=1 Tax=Eleginops maclovinus TaxID=56733 RepID=A0AAN7X4L6_ELEMC|nr:hypothetical protein PBY51_004684 [Eleginops maclovinus]